MLRLQVSYDLLDTYPGGPYKSRGGSIKKTRFVEEEEVEDDEDEDEDQVLYPSFLEAQSTDTAIVAEAYVESEYLMVNLEWDTSIHSQGRCATEAVESGGVGACQVYVVVR